LPEIDKGLHFVEVHKGDIVDMPIGLSLQYNCRRETLVTHSFREGLVIGAVVVHFIAELLNRDAILTLLIRLMLAFAFGLDL
jgi:hypothetical protein